jgi:probable HAF family extracellular repeat protein
VDPFLWSPETGKLTDLGSLGGTFGAPFFLNNRGQVVGLSNLPGDTSPHPFLWSKSEGMKDLGTLGGSFGQPNWINDAGEIVGQASNEGDQNYYAFLWRHGVMTNLGTIGSDPYSQAFCVNSRSQIVGTTYLPSLEDHHGFLSENGAPLIDLQTLVVPGSDVTVISALVINDLGEIAAHGMLPNGDIHAIVLIPCDANHPAIHGCNYSLADPMDEAPERRAQVTQTPAARPSKLSPTETTARFRSPREGRNRRFGTPQTLPQ